MLRIPGRDPPELELENLGLGLRMLELIRRGPEFLNGGGEGLRGGERQGRLEFSREFDLARVKMTEEGLRGERQGRLAFSREFARAKETGWELALFRDSEDFELDLGRARGRGFVTSMWIACLAVLRKKKKTDNENK